MIINVSAALVPALDIVWNVKSFSHRLIVNILRQEIVAHKVGGLSVMLDPRSVLTHGPALFVPFFLAINKGHSGSVCLNIWTSRVNIPVKIIPVESTSEFSHSVHGLIAQSDVVSLPRLEVVEVLLAMV